MEIKFSFGNVVFRNILCLVICSVMVLGTTLTAFAASTSKGESQDLGQSGTVQGHLDGLGTPNWYKITPNNSQYYRFTFYNQSVETRLGVSVADSLLNMFLGKMSVVIYDSYDAVLADGDVKCGYDGSVSLRLEQGQTYYIKLTSTVAGNYKLVTENFADIGENQWNTAQDMLTNGQLISSVDAQDDTDWFQFTADREQSFYRFSLENISGNGDMKFNLYEYVAGAGETPLREVLNFSVRKGNTAGKDISLKEGQLYYYCISGGVGGYQLNVSQTLDVAGSTNETAYPMETGKKYTTSFDGTGDLDAFTFITDSKEAYYHFDFDSYYDGSDYLYFSLYDEAGNEVGKYNNRFMNLPWGCNYKLEPNATYYVHMSRATSQGGIANYSLQITVQADEHPNELQGAVAVEANQKISASFDGNGDIDWFTFTTGSEVSYYTFCFDSSYNDSSYFHFSLCDTEGNELEKYNNRFMNLPQNCNYKLEPNTTYFFQMGSDVDEVIAKYTVEIKTSTDPEGNTMEQALSLPFNQKETRQLVTEEDVDWFTFLVEKEGEYNFRLVNEMGGSLGFVLYNQYERELKAFTVPEVADETLSLSEGTYYLKVYRNYGNTKYYSLFVSDSVGDLNGDSKIDAKDALEVLKASVGKVTLDDTKKSFADVNKDTKIDAKDALEILKYAVGKPSVIIKV